MNHKEKKQNDKTIVKIMIIIDIHRLFFMQNKYNINEVSSARQWAKARVPCFHKLIIYIVTNPSDIHRSSIYFMHLFPISNKICFISICKSNITLDFSQNNTRKKVY